LRILYLNHNPAGVGTWQRASHFGRAMALRGHEVTMVTTHPRRRVGFEVLEDGSYTEVRAPDLLFGPARAGWDPTNAIRRLLRLRRYEPDLVHAFDSRPVVIGPALSVVRRTGATLFLDWADWWGRGGRIDERSGWLVRTCFGPVETWFEEAFRVYADGTTTTSAALAARAADLGVEPARIWTFPNGCDPGTGDLPEQSHARGALGVDPSTPLILHAGVLTPGDMAQLSSAFEHMTRVRPDVHLVFAGNHTAPIPASLRESGRVRRLGFVPTRELRLWLAASDVCVIPMTDTPNNRGRWPGRINDYLAAGRPTVMPRVGDAALMLEAHGAGWTCDARPDALAESLLEALASPGARVRAGERARALAEGPLTWAVLAERLESAYNATLRVHSNVAQIGSGAHFHGGRSSAAVP